MLPYAGAARQSQERDMIVIVSRSRLMPGVREDCVAVVDAWSNLLRPCRATFDRNADGVTAE